MILGPKPQNMTEALAIAARRLDDVKYGGPDDNVRHVLDDLYNAIELLTTIVTTDSK